MAHDAAAAENHLAAVERLQDLWLGHMERLLQDGSATSTDLATLARVLMANGWCLDRSRLPTGLSEKLLSKLDPSTLDEDDAVIARIG